MTKLLPPGTHVKYIDKDSQDEGGSNVAKILATVSGTALKPGASRNNRYYSAEAIAGAVRKADAQLAEGALPLTMRSHHAADDDSTRVVGAVRSLTLAEDGSARFTAEIADTPHGRTIASLLDTADGRPAFLSGVSIRGAWDGRVRKIKGAAGEALEAGDSLTLHGLDYTATPGVPGAGVDAFAWAKNGASETAERVLITESVPEARMTLTEEITPTTETAPPDVPGGIREALRVIFGAAPVPVTEGGDAPGDGSKPYGNVPYGDPGYQKDGQKRYPLNSAAHVKAAWSYINQAKNAGQYTAAQLKRVKGRIKAAAGKFGIKIASEGWTIDPAFQVTEAVAEFYRSRPGRRRFLLAYRLKRPHDRHRVFLRSRPRRPGCDPRESLRGRRERARVPGPGHGR